MSLLDTILVIQITLT